MDNSRPRPIPYKVHLNKIVINDGVLDHFAPFYGPFVCQSINGYWRKRHDYDSDGRCIFCNKESSLLQNPDEL